MRKGSPTSSTWSRATVLRSPRRSNAARSTSVSCSRREPSIASMTACRSRWWRVCIPAASSCSCMTHPSRHRPERQTGRRSRCARRARSAVRLDHGGARRGRPREGHRLGHDGRRCQPDGAVRPGRDRCVPGFRDGLSGAARPQDRSFDPQHGAGQAVVAVLLLPVGRQRGFCPGASGRDQTCAARHPEGDRPVQDRAGACRTADGRRRFHQGSP